MISQNINKLIAEALKAREQVRLSTLRMLSSSFNYERIEKQHELTEEEELAVVMREAKKHKDSIEAYKAAGRQELVDRESAELKILEEFLPQQISDAELESIVGGVVAETGISEISGMGRVIGLVMKKVAGRADGARVSSKVREKLSK